MAVTDDGTTNIVIRFRTPPQGSQVQHAKKIGPIGSKVLRT